MFTGTHWHLNLEEALRQKGFLHLSDWERPWIYTHSLGRSRKNSAHCEENLPFLKCNEKKKDALLPLEQNHLFKKGQQPVEINTYDQEKEKKKK